MYYSIATVSAFTIEVNASKFGPLIAELHFSKNIHEILSIGNCHIFGTSSFIKTIIQFSAPSYKNIRLNPVTTAINNHQI